MNFSFLRVLQGQFSKKIPSTAIFLWFKIYSLLLRSKKQKGVQFWCLAALATKKTWQVQVTCMNYETYSCCSCCRGADIMHPSKLRKQIFPVFLTSLIFFSRYDTSVYSVHFYLLVNYLRFYLFYLNFPSSI